MLDDLDENFWERKRDEYLAKINSIYDANKYKINPQKVLIEDLIENGNFYDCIFRFVNETDIASICRSINVKLFDDKLREISFIIQSSDLKDKIIYGNENKRITIRIHKSLIYGINDYNLNCDIHSKIISYWRPI